MRGSSLPASRCGQGTKSQGPSPIARVDIAQGQGWPYARVGRYCTSHLHCLGLQWFCGCHHEDLAFQTLAMSREPGADDVREAISKSVRADLTPQLLPYSYE